MHITLCRLSSQQVRAGWENNTKHSSQLFDDLNVFSTMSDVTVYALDIYVPDQDRKIMRAPNSAVAT